MMKKRLLIVALLFSSSPLFAMLQVAGGQGYGSFRLAGAGSTKAASVLYAGIKFCKYFELRYSSLDTSLRMPVLPFRLVELKYNEKNNGRVNTYTAYDSDVFGLNVLLPLTERWQFSVLYGIGRSKISQITQNGAPNDNDLAVIHRGLIHAVDVQTTYNFKVMDVFFLSPKIGVLTHFLDGKSGYSNAMSIYAAMSVSYLLDSKKENI